MKIDERKEFERKIDSLNYQLESLKERLTSIKIETIKEITSIFLDLTKEQCDVVYAVDIINVAKDFYGINLKRV